MIDSTTGKPIEVLVDTTSGPYLRVPADQLELVCQLLHDNDVPHWVNPIRVSVDGRPAVALVYLRKGSNPRPVQALLDGA